jgi:polyisoprenoid-binding protein YceI
MKMKKIIVVIGLLMFTSAMFAQKYITKNGHIWIYSDTPLETIEAHNHQVNCAIDASTGDMVFKVLMKSFEFEKALMQEHFNENFIESDKFPNAVFKGKITNIDDMDLTKSGEYEAIVEGDLTIHGVTRSIKQKGTLVISGNKIDGRSVFMIEPSDYDIKIPSTVVNKIEKEIQVTVDITLDKFE